MKIKVNIIYFTVDFILSGDLFTMIRRMVCQPCYITEQGTLFENAYDKTFSKYSLSGKLTKTPRSLP